MMEPEQAQGWAERVLEELGRGSTLLRAGLLCLLLSRSAFAVCDPTALPTTITGGVGLQTWAHNQCNWDQTFNSNMILLNSFTAAVGTGTPAANSVCTDGQACSMDNSWINVMDPTYGATGNGTTDDTAAIQAALTAAATLGYPEVFMPAGIYKLSSGLTVNNVILRGAGPGATGTTRGGSILLGTGMTSGTVVVATDTIHNGAMRPTALRDFAILCNAAGQAKGTHMTNPVEGIRLDTTTQIENVRAQYCEYGLRTNAATGHQFLLNFQAINNYCGMTVNLVGSGGTDGGNFTAVDSAFAGSSFAGVCLPASGGAGGMGDAHFIRTGFGFSPYAFWQQGPATTQMLGATIFDDCEFEALGNGAFFAKNKSAAGGQLGNVYFNLVGYSDSSTDNTLNLPTSACTADNTPYECCTGNLAGCTHTYAMDVGPCNVVTIKSGIHPFGTPNGGSGAIHCTQCLAKLQVTLDAGTSPVVTCDTHPEFVDIEDGGGGHNWLGNTPTDTPVTCASTSKGWQYFDTSLTRQCYCNGSVWCQVAHPTNAECTGAAAPAACCSGAGAGTCCNTNSSCG